MLFQDFIDIEIGSLIVLVFIELIGVFLFTEILILSIVFQVVVGNCSSYSSINTNTNHNE